MRRDSLTFEVMPRYVCQIRELPDGEALKAIPNGIQYVPFPRHQLTVCDFVFTHAGLQKDDFAAALPAAVSAAITGNGGSAA